MRTTDSIQPLGANKHTRTRTHARGQRTRGLSKLLEAGLRYQVPLRSQKLPLRDLTCASLGVSGPPNSGHSANRFCIHPPSLSLPSGLCCYCGATDHRRAARSRSLSLATCCRLPTTWLHLCSQTRCARRTRKAARTSQHTAARGLPRGPRKAKSALFSRRACPCYGMAANTKVWRTNFWRAPCIL